MRSFLRTQLVLLAVTVVVLELALQVASHFSLEVRRLIAAPWETQSPTISDRRLVVRGNPLNADADAWGYRNPRRPAQVDIVTLGDSQTYGPETRDEAWPIVLGGAAGRSVYNMALPAYGPVQSYLQLDEALSLKPKLVIVAPYFGNDFYEAFLIFRRHHPEFAQWLAPQMAEAAFETERTTQPIYTDVSALFRFNQAPANSAAQPGAGAAGSSSSGASSLWQWASKNIKLYGFVRALKHRLQPKPVTPLLSRKLETAAAALSADKQRYASVFDGHIDGNSWRTVLTAPYRNRVIDDRDPRIRAGFEVARQAVKQMAQRCQDAGVDFLVVLIPTKETVFFPRVKDPDAHPELKDLAANETRLKREWIADLQAHKIRYVDAFVPLSTAARQPYPEDFDGHPTPFGHQLIAAEVARALGAAPRSASTSPVQ